MTMPLIGKQMVVEVQFIVKTFKQSLFQVCTEGGVVLYQKCGCISTFGNFNQLSSDMHLVMEKFNIPRELYRNKSYWSP